MWRPQEDSNVDTGFSLDELAEMINVYRRKLKVDSTRSKTPPTAASATTRSRPTKASLEAMGRRVSPSSGMGFILPMGPSKGR